MGGYLFVPIELALIVAFYFVTNRYFGWWQPSESLSDPNILGSALPALAPIGMALQAGFMEECLFRAVPLSLAALIGARLGHRRLALGFALVLQAVIFGAAHANYPGFPAYSRLVELIGPALIWGLVFLRFGLLPTITLHALFDLVLMSLPVFLVDGPECEAQPGARDCAGMVPLR
jgi:membrane protease YdiL (CAAX protease family)